MLNNHDLNIKQNNRYYSFCHNRPVLQLKHAYNKIKN